MGGAFETARARGRRCLAAASAPADLSKINARSRPIPHDPAFLMDYDPPRGDVAMSAIKDALAAFGIHLWVLIGTIRNEYFLSMPAPRFWFTGSAAFTMGSFALFAVLSFAGIANMSATYRKWLVSGYFVAIALFVVGWSQSARQEENTAALQTTLARLATPVQPDLSLRLVDPKEPTVQVVNMSDGIAHTVRYSPALFNIDASDPNQSLLSIPTAGPDFVRPHSVGGGPTIIFNSSIQSQLKSGDRIFGTIGLACPECKRGRAYWVYIVWSQGGWFSEVQNDDNGDLIVPKGQNHWDMSVVKQIIDSIPVSSRFEIKDREHIDINNP
jgi:hypothetical protein